jgi:membrane protein DedA with SNARE-associated domain
LAFYIAILVFLYGALPSADEIIGHLEDLYGRFGYEIIFLGAFLEGALLIDLFVPGISIVLFGAVFSKTGIIDFPMYLITAFLGFSLGFLVDYLIGYFGLSGIMTKLGMGQELEKAKGKLRKVGGRAFLLGYFHPDVATLFVTAAGAIKLPLKEFFVYNFIAGFFWLTFWSGIAYFAGEGLIELIRGYFLATLIASVIIWVVVRAILKRRK